MRDIDGVYLNKDRLRFVSGPCGSGKTEAAIGYISDHLNHRNYLYVAPTIALTEEVLGRLRKVGIESKVITSTTHRRNVGQHVVQYLKDAHLQVRSC